MSTASTLVHRPAPPRRRRPPAEPPPAALGRYLRHAAACSPSAA